MNQINKYLQHITLAGGNEKGKEFILSDIFKNHIETEGENQTEIEHILDYLYKKQDLDISNFGYTRILEKAESYFKTLRKNAPKNNIEKEGDVEVLKEWDNGYKIVKLITKEAYQREGVLMSHCVESFYGRDCEVYSLRDERNFPHCTMEKGNQIKGKGNHGIVEKYIDYVVEFLETTGMEMRDNEMENLGYTNIYFYKQIGITKDNLTLFRDKYFYGDINKAFRDDVEVHICDSVTEAKELNLI